MPSDTPSLLDLRFVVLSGKGGVGRTTVAAALARAAATRGKRVLIAQTDAVDRLARMFGSATAVGPTTRALAPGIDAVNMTPRDSLHEYALMILKYEAVYRALFENRAVRGFLSAVPGLDAYAMLGKAWWHSTETSGGAPKYDLVILDGPASGHIVTLLKIPRSLVGATPAGPLARDARAMVELFADKQRSALVIVTRPEELPVEETRELARAATRDLGIGLGPVIVNAVPPDRFSDPAVAATLDRVAIPTGDGDLDATLNLAAGMRAHRHTADVALLELARDPGLPLISLPALPVPALGPAEIDRLAAALSRSLDPTSLPGALAKDVR